MQRPVSTPSLVEVTDKAREFLRFGLHDDAVHLLMSHEADCRNEGIPHNGVWCANVSLLLGIVHRKRGEFDSAEQEITHAVQHFSQTGDATNHACATLALGDVYRARAICEGDQHEAKVIWEQALELYRRAEGILVFLDRSSFLRTENQRLYPQILWAIGRVFLALATNLDVAAHNFGKAWKISRRLDFYWGQEECAQLIGRLAEARGNPRSARRWYRRSLCLSRQSGNVDRIMENLLYLARLSQSTLENPSNVYDLANQAYEVVIPLLANQSLPPSHQFHKYLAEARHLMKWGQSRIVHREAEILE